MNKPAKRTFSTPMMQQYMKIKREYDDCLLFFRLGDFYELFLEDAKVGAKVLGITLTQRPRGKDGRIPMAGVPYHAADAYISKLVKAGYKVAICEQVSEPDKRGIVDREVVRVVTPGTVLDEKTLEDKENNYTMCISFDEKHVGIAVADISTGDFQSAQIEYDQDFTHTLSREFASFRPAECILSARSYENHELLKLLSAYDINVYKFDEWDKFANHAKRNLTKHFKIQSLAVFGIEDKHLAIKASSVLLAYLKHTQKDKISHIKVIRNYSSNDFVVLDSSTITNLELFSTIRDRDDKGSLVSLLDQTSTSMGGRLVREWVKRPLRRKGQVQERLDAVEELYDNPLLRNKIRKSLNKLYDVERIISRMSVGIGVPADLVNLKLTLQSILDTKQILKDFKSNQIRKIDNGIIEKINSIIEVIDQYINEDSIGQKGVWLIKEGVNQDLDELRKQISGDKDWIAALEKKERDRTGISSLKVKFNKVFGYYIEISKSNLNFVPEVYIRKQTLVNAERFITPELKEKEEIILRGQERIEELERKIFEEVVAKTLAHTKLLQDISKKIATLDVLSNFAHLAARERYVRPEILTDGELRIEDGRHPVVEKMLSQDDKQFIPNDVLLSSKEQQLIVLTGPNMAGKSVFIRQVAIITLMAHIGSFVPAKKAKVSLVDRVFVRSGASDVITSGLSTFMVEMVETAHILNHATDKSLVVIDEIGRGTSTYDGISIAWAVAEYLVKNKRLQAKTLFATHYHELQMLGDRYPKRITNYQMSVEEENGEPIFLYKVEKGGTSHSYAVAVARLAGIPKEVTDNALEILHLLENKRFVSNGEMKQSKSRFKFKSGEEVYFTDYINNIDVDKLTPIEALNELYKLQRKVNRK